MIRIVETLSQKPSLWVAARILIGLPALFVVFHLLIVAGTLPRDIVWGGRLTDATLVPFEALAIFINLLLMATGVVAAKIIRDPAICAVIFRIKWVLFYFVVVNTVLALFSATTFEVLLTPVTALYALCLYRIIRLPDGFGG